MQGPGQGGRSCSSADGGVGGSWSRGILERPPPPNLLAHAQCCLPSFRSHQDANNDNSCPHCLEEILSTLYPINSFNPVSNLPFL
jgi:hypothetical protein